MALRCPVNMKSSFPMYSNNSSHCLHLPVPMRLVNIPGEQMFAWPWFQYPVLKNVDQSLWCFPSNGCSVNRAIWCFVVITLWLRWDVRVLHYICQKEVPDKRSWISIQFSYLWSTWFVESGKRSARVSLKQLLLGVIPIDRVLFSDMCWLRVTKWTWATWTLGWFREQNPQR